MDVVQPKSSIVRGFLSVAQFASALGVRPETIRQWVQLGRLPAIKLGNLTLIPSDALRRMLDRQEEKHGS